VSALSLNNHIRRTGDSFCPECYGIHNEKRYDFDEMDAEEHGPARYRCEECGVIIVIERVYQREGSKIFLLKHFG
jgi:hypothetical protein